MSRADMLELGDPINEDSEFSLLIVGSCPHCGSPIWAKKPVELLQNPPENLFSCDCREIVRRNLMLGQQSQWTGGYWTSDYDNSSSPGGMAPAITTPTITIHPNTGVSGDESPNWRYRVSEPEVTHIRNPVSIQFSSCGTNGEADNKEGVMDDREMEMADQLGKIF